jgi:hypothetical protein
MDVIMRAPAEPFTGAAHAGDAFNVKFQVN